MTVVDGRRIPTLFISHAQADADIACVAAIQAWLNNNLLGAVNFYSASDPEANPPGGDWIARLRGALVESDAMICLVSPNSVGRDWLSFEAGAGYGREIPVIPVCWGGLRQSDLLPPLSLLQAIELPSHDGEVLLLSCVASIAGLQRPQSPAQLRLPPFKARTPAIRTAPTRRWRPHL